MIAKPASFAVLPFVLGSLGCAPEPADELEPPPDCDSNCLSHDFGRVPVPAGVEIPTLCWSWTVNNADPLYVNAVAMQNDGSFHHSNWFWVPDSAYAMPDGAWDCSQAAFDEIAASVLGDAIFAQTTQSRDERQGFVPGAAIEVGEDARIIANSHILNVSGDDVETGLRVQLHTLAEEEVDVRLQPMRFTYFDLDIPADSETRHSGECDLDGAHQAVLGEPLDMRLHYALPHLHDLGSSFRLELLGGPRDGEAIVEQHDLWGEASGVTLPEPLDLGEAGATGLRFTCEHRNHRDDWVGWGIGDQEMCVMLGYADAGMGFDGSVGLTTERGEAGGVLERTGTCDLRGLAAR